MAEMRVRFLVNRASKRILYMEVGKAVVDLLVAFMQLPVATILGIFNTEEAGSSAALKLGSISNAYESLQKMSEASLVVSKESILNPPCALRLSKKSPQLFTTKAPPSTAPRFAEANFGASSLFGSSAGFAPSSSSPFGSSAGFPSFSTSPMFGSAFSAPSKTAQAASTSTKEAPAGYVKDHLSFIVTDDLCILPASTIETIVLLNKLNVEKLSDLDGLDCSLTPDEALELLRASLISTEALNHAFHAKVAHLHLRQGQFRKSHINEDFSF